MSKFSKTPGSTRTVRGLRLSVAMTVLTGLILLPGTLPAQALTPPSLKLISVNPEMTILRHNAAITLPADPSVYVASSNGNFEIRATRPDYDTPVSLEQWVDGGAQKIPLPAGMSDGFQGLNGFLHVTVKDAGNNSVYDKTQDFCPASGNRQRVDDSGVQVATYPSYGCGNNPFTIGSVWGIDKGWAVGALGSAGYGYYGYGYYGYGIPGTDTRFSGPDGVYTIHVSIPQAYIDQFGIDPNDASVNVTLTVQTKKSCSYICTDTAGASSSREPTAPQTPGPRVPTNLNPDPSTLPDLIPLPAFAMRIAHSKSNGHDYLRFGADVWNDGPSGMVVEGFRRQGEPVMDAFQYFYDSNGVAVGRAPTGTMEYDALPGHTHWHFEQFASYSLLDSTQTQIVKSEKVGFCLAPTDPINLAGEGANWFPYSIGLGTACGTQDSIWTRESLDAGWGDTYYQYLPGQSFDVTHLPNGHYFVQVQANPDGLLYERNTGNDTSLREIILKGRKGSRKVEVLPYHGIQTG